MTIRRRDKITLQDVHYTKKFYNRFLNSLSEPISEIVICSPFFGKLPKPFDDIVSFCTFVIKRGVDVIRVITRPPGIDDTAMPIEAAKTLMINGVEIYIRTSPYLHAKLYHIEYQKGYFRSFIGSSNFTLGGFKRNYELVTEMEGVGDNSPCHREIQRLLNQNGVVSYDTWIKDEMPSDKESTI